MTNHQMIQIAEEFNKVCTTIRPPQEMTALIEKHIHPYTKREKIGRYEGTKCAKWLTKWAEMNNLKYKFRFVTSGGFYSNPRVKGWNPNADTSMNEENAIFYEYQRGNAWVGSSECGIVIERI